MIEGRPRSGAIPLRWWLLLMLILAVAAMATVGRHPPVPAFDAQPVSADPPLPPLDTVRAV